MDHHLNPPPPDYCQFRSSFATIGSGGSVGCADSADEPVQGASSSLSVQTCCSLTPSTTSTPREERRPLSQSISPGARQQGCTTNTGPADISPYSRHSIIIRVFRTSNKHRWFFWRIPPFSSMRQRQTRSAAKGRNNAFRELPYSSRARLPRRAHQRESEWMEDSSQRRRTTRQPQLPAQAPHRRRLTRDDENHQSQQLRVYREQQQNCQRQQYQDFLVAELNRMSLVEQQHQQQDGGGVHANGSVPANYGYSPFARNIIRTTQDDSAVSQQQQQPQHYHYYSDAVDEHAEYYYPPPTAGINHPPPPSPRYFPESSHHHPHHPLYQQEPTRQQPHPPPQLQSLPPPPPRPLLLLPLLAPSAPQQAPG